jgi:hypothetical protein
MHHMARFDDREVYRDICWLVQVNSNAWGYLIDPLLTLRGEGLASCSKIRQRLGCWRRDLAFCGLDQDRLGTEYRF